MLLAHVHQEELSKLAINETCGSPNDGSQHLQLSIFPHDWHGHFLGYGSGMCQTKGFSQSVAFFAL